ncbi:DUF3231 family protein [Ferdinandcohnia quinoae]|uniref:DUF3231 family protein n=1 Tax=Fredinandcohnia quinoae TaxID=2918902 RepID=A0AAW5E5L9_9BACI|nr:DUF3231 family protein [Fredinandcohnia sp. SECRCQ15]MCH1627643.1 DUF3231 family protein [Fredinandcohnia sp. SECRCQ15]
MQQNERLTSTEISNLWTHYIRETLQICVIKHKLLTGQDREIHRLFLTALELSKKHVEIMKNIFSQLSFPIPIGFTDDDVNLEAPPLYTDLYCLDYLHTMTMHGAQAYGLAFSGSIRQDIRDFYYQCNIDTMDLYNKSIEVLISKGLYQSPPHYITPNSVSIISNLNYVTNIFGQARKMNSIESGNIFFNLKKSILAKASFLAVQQVSKDNEVSQFIEKCIKVKNKHIAKFSQLLLEDDLHTPRSLETEITNSTVAPFSEKLMLFHSGFLIAAAISYYGTAAVACMRADIAVHCEKSILDDLIVFAAFGKLMIKKKWLEQPPEASDRNFLPH